MKRSSPARRISAVLVVPLFGLALALGASQNLARAETGAAMVVLARDHAGAPVADASVALVPAAGTMVVGKTDARGEVRFDALVPGEYGLVVTFGDSTGRSDAVHVEAGRTLHFTVRFGDSDPGEVIRIREHVGASRAAEPQALKSSIAPRPPYSDEAILQNRSATVWMRLDVDERGRVRDVRVLKSPADPDLERIAVAQAYKLRFSPGTDELGDPVAKTVYWRIHWTPYWGFQTEMNRMAIERCYGSGPLPLEALGGGELSYKDCTPPAGYERVSWQSGKVAPVWPQPRVWR